VNPEEFDRLLALMDPEGVLNAEEQKALVSIWQPFSAARRTVITAQGDTEAYLHFVLEGLQRVCHYTEDGKEATVVFTFPPSFGGIIDSFLLQSPSRYTYETLSPSVFIRARFVDFEALMKQHAGIVRAMQLGTARVLSGVMERMVELQCLSSEEKFRRLLQRSPHILQVVPHKYLANYIGIDPTNFSKLMNTVKI